MLRPGEQAILDERQGPMMMVGPDGCIAAANPPALALLGWDDSLVGRPLSTIIPARLRARHWVGFQRYLETGESRLQGSTVRVPALRRDGTETEVDLTIRVFRRPDGSLLASAALEPAGSGAHPEGITELEGAFARRLYELV